MGEAFSHDYKQAAALFGGTELTPSSNQRAIIAVLLISVLTRLGGASQEDQQPAYVKGIMKGAVRVGPAPFCF